MQDLLIDDVVLYLEAKGHNVRQLSDGTYRTNCPIHNGKNKTSFVIFDNGVGELIGYDCKSCGAKGFFIIEDDEIKIRESGYQIKRKESLPNLRKKAQKKADTFKSNRDKVSGYSGSNATNYKDFTNTIIQHYKQFINSGKKHSEYFEKRMVSEKIIEKYKLSIVYFKGAYRVIIPSWKNNKAYSFNSRSIDDHVQPKSIKCKLNDTDDNGNIIRYDYLYFNSRYIYKDVEEPIYIVEGEFDALSMESIGFKAIALSGTGSLNKIQEEIISSNTNNTYILIPDNDEAGYKMLESCQIPYFKIPEEYKDINDYIVDNKLNINKVVKYIKKNTKSAKNKAKELRRSLRAKQLYNQWYVRNPKTGKISNINPGILTEYLLNKYRALNTKDMMYIYEDGVYKYKDDVEVKGLIAENIEYQYRRSNTIKDIFNLWYIDKSIKINTNDLNSNPYVLNLKNGLLDLRTMELQEHTPDLYSTIQLNANYNPEAKGERFLKFLDDIVPDKEMQLLIQEIFGYAMTNFNNAKKAFIFYGVGDSGKSTLLNVLEDMVDNKYISNIPLQDLGDRFNKALLFGKILNIYSDLPSKPMRDDNILKLLTGNDTVNAEFKGKDGFSFKNKAKFIFSTNELPDNYGDKTNEFYKRLIIIPFQHSVPKEKQDPELNIKLKEEADFIFNWALTGLKRLMKNNFIFTENETTQKLLNEYKDSYNNVTYFVKNICELDENAYTIKSELYKTYRIFCKNNGLEPLGSRNFFKEIEKEYPSIDADARFPRSRKRAFKGIAIIEDVDESDYECLI